MSILDTRFHLRLTIVAALTLLSAACGIETEFAKASRELQAIDASLDHAINTFAIESARAQATAKQIEVDFSKHNQETLGRTLSTTLADASSHAAGQIQSTELYVELKIRGLLKSLGDAVDKAKKDLADAEARDDKSAIASILREVAETPIYLDPYFTSFVPANVALKHTDYTATQLVFADPSQPFVKGYGWGFQQPKKPAFTVSIRPPDGKDRELSFDKGEISVANTTELLVQFVFPRPTVFAGCHGHNLVIRTDTEPLREHLLPIVIETPPRPVEPPQSPTIVKARVRFQVTDDCRDKQDYLVVQLFANDEIVFQGTIPETRTIKFPPAFGGKEVTIANTDKPWPDNTGPYDLEKSLTRPVPRGQMGKIIIQKLPSQDGVSLNVQCTGFSSDNKEYGYHTQWDVHLEDESLLVSWGFVW